MSDSLKFCVEGKLAEDLKAAADEINSSPQALLEGLVDQFVARHKAFKSGSDERRSFARMQISLPAIVYVEDSEGNAVRYQPATIRDISPSGLGFSCGGKKLCGRLADECYTGFTFELIISLSDEMQPVRFRCRSQRVQLVGDELMVGAVIEEADPVGNQLYQKVYEQGLVC